MKTKDIISAINSVDKTIKKVNEINKKYPPRYKEELDRIGDAVVTQWYDTYDPIYYSRLGRLYDMYKVTLTKDKCIVHFGYPIIGIETYIYYNSFVEGAHGGARSGENHPNPGVPYWRRYCTWGRPALVSFSPYDRMQIQMNNMIRKIDKERDSEFRFYIDKMVKAIGRL